MEKQAQKAPLTKRKPSRRETSPVSDAQLERLFGQYSRQVVAAAYRVTGSRQDAEDVLQTVFLRLARRQSELEESPTIGAYLRRAAVNASLDLLRSRSRAGAIPLDDMALEMADPANISAERHVEGGEFRRELREALLELPEQSARLFALRYFEGLTNKELAAMLGMSQVAVAVVLHRARKRLRLDLHEFVKGDAS